MTRDNLFAELPKIKRSAKKFVLLTHTDLDGAGAAVILKVAFPNAYIEVKHCPNNTMSADILNALRRKHNHPEEYLNTMIVATDISVNQVDAELVNSLVDDDFILLDHHSTAEHLNQYSWACVYGGKIDDSPRVTKFDLHDDWHTSGTALLYEYLAYVGIIDVINNYTLMQFAHLVSAYDTWDWKTTKCDKTNIEELNSLCHIYGLEEFEEMFAYKVMNHLDFLDMTDRILLRAERNKVDAYLERISKSIVEGILPFEGKEYMYAACISTTYVAQVFDFLRNEYSDKDLFIIVTCDSISIRTDLADLDVGKLAAAFGGGGHPGAAGFPISQDQRKAIVKIPLTSPYSLSTVGDAEKQVCSNSKRMNVS